MQRLRKMGCVCSWTVTITNPYTNQKVFTELGHAYQNEKTFPDNVSDLCDRRHRPQSCLRSRVRGPGQGS